MVFPPILRDSAFHSEQADRRDCAVPLAGHFVLCFMARYIVRALSAVPAAIQTVLLDSRGRRCHPGLCRRPPGGCVPIQHVHPAGMARAARHLLLFPAFLDHHADCRRDRNAPTCSRQHCQIRAHQHTGRVGQTMRRLQIFLLPMALAIAGATASAQTGTAPATQAAPQAPGAAPQNPAPAGVQPGQGQVETAPQPQTGPVPPSPVPVQAQSPVTPAPSSEALPPKHVAWSFTGAFGIYDRVALQRGFQVYKEVCSACHALSHVAFRNLGDPGGPEFSQDEVKAIAASYKIPAGPNEQGQTVDANGTPLTRPGTPADYFPSPFPNEQAARTANNGALPPDLSLIVKAREGNQDYVYSILTGFGQKPPANETIANGLYYNPYFP